MRIWDYKIDQKWRPKTDQEWRWFLVRKINYGEFKGIKREVLEKYFPRIKNLLDPGKRNMIEYFLNS